MFFTITFHFLADSFISLLPGFDSHESGIMLNVLKPVFPFLPRPDSERLQTKNNFIKSLSMLSKSSYQLLSVPI